MTATTLDTETARIRDAQSRHEFPIKTHLMPWETDTLSAGMVARGVGLGALTVHGCGWSPVERTCTDCRKILPLLVWTDATGWRFDDFERCSQHAF